MWDDKINKISYNQVNATATSPNIRNTPKKRRRILPNRGNEDCAILYRVTRPQQDGLLPMATMFKSTAVLV